MSRRRSKNSRYKAIKREGIVFVFLLFAGIVAGGCSSVLGNGVVKGITGRTNGHFRKIAVLPFNNISGKKEASKIIADMYVTEFFKDARFKIEEPGNVRQFIVQERVELVGEVEIDKLKILGRRLKVDAVVVGTVEEFDDGRDGSPMVAISARMVESNSGRVVWYAYNKKRGDDYIIIFDFGRIRTVTTLANRVVKEMIDTIRW